MYIKLIFMKTIYKYHDSSVLHTPTVQLFGSLSQTHTLLVQTHKHDVSDPCLRHRVTKTQELNIRVCGKSPIPFIEDLM